MTFQGGVILNDPKVPTTALLKVVSLSKEDFTSDFDGIFFFFFWAPYPL